MYEQSIHVEGRFLGSFIRPATIVHAERQPPYSYVYVCPECGDLWARCPVSDTDGNMSKFQVQGGYCRKHPGPSPFTVAGSLLLSWEPEYSSLLLSCPDMVLWEFNRHMEFFERRNLE